MASTIEEPRDIYLFSYGSNSTQQLRCQVKNFKLETKPALLKGYVRVFCSNSKRWGGGVASLAASRSKSAFTHGSIALITATELKRLDACEVGYRQARVTVCIGQKRQKEVSAIAFVVGKDRGDPDAPFKTPPLKMPPSEHYIQAVYSNLREHWSIDCITVRSNDVNKGIVKLKKEPICGDKSELSLEALCVEVALNKSTPWVLPDAIDNVVQKLHDVGIVDTKGLILALEDPVKLNQHIKAKGYNTFQNDTIAVMRKLLYPTESEIDLSSHGGTVLEDINDQVLLFSYGSNSTQQLRARVQNPTLISYPATLKGFHRVFCRKSILWGGGGIASLAPAARDDPDALTRGAVVTLTRKELELLDSFEVGYRKVNVKITVGHLSSKEVDAVTYVAGAEPKTNKSPFTPALKTPPTDQYLWAIYGNLREHWTVDSITVRSNDRKKGLVELHERVLPEDVSDLSLEEFCVEISLNKSTPWVMPQAIRPVCRKLKGVGINDIVSLKEALVNPKRLNRKLVKNGLPKFESETLAVMSKILFPEQNSEIDLMVSQPNDKSNVQAQQEESENRFEDSNKKAEETQA